MTPSFLALVAVLGALVLAWLGWPLLRPARVPMALPLRSAAIPVEWRRRRPFILGALALTLVAAGAAWWRAQEPGAAAALPDPARAAAIARVKATIEELRGRVQLQPDDAPSWEKLGLSHAALGHPAEALDALRQAQRLRPADATVLAEVALAVVVANGPQADDEPARLVARALEIEPANPKALALAGTLALQRKDYVVAIRHWEALARIEPADSAVGRQLQAGLAEARKRADMVAARSAAKPGAGMPTGTTTMGTVQAGVGQPGSARAGSAGGASTQPEAAGGWGPARVGGSVSLAAALRARVEPDDTLFVFARAADGAGPPLAVLRRKVRDLPLAFTLDDSLAVAPGARLSGVERVVIGARISKSGQAIARPGDLEGRSAPVAIGRTDLELEIDRVVPARP